MADAPQRKTGLKGKVRRKKFGVGSKSERQAFWLETAHGDLVLRRKGRTAFQDSGLKRFNDKEVRCDGFVVGETLLAEKIELLQSEGKHGKEEKKEKAAKRRETRKK